MSAIAISSIAFGCVTGGALLGMYLRAVLPREHLSEDSKDVVKMGMGLVATMSALVLSLVVSSGKSSFDALSNEMTKVASEIILLDQTLALYRPETKEARELLRGTVAAVCDRMESRKSANPRNCGYQTARRTLSTKSLRDSCRRTTGNVPSRPGLWSF